MNASKIVKAGLIVGSLDILAALLQYYIKTGKNPGNVLKFIASGVFGKEAFSGGTVMIIAGLILHFIIAFAFTIFFFWIIPKIHALSRYRILTGIAYGIFIWLVMQFIVLPLSNTPPLTLNVKGSLAAIGILIVCIGLPLSLMAANQKKKPMSL